MDVGIRAPSAIPADGFVGKSGKFHARVGIWIMPDNRRSGALENFILDLIEQNDQLIVHAEESNKKAGSFGAQYGNSDTEKAILHAWLAWQKTPGLPYGSAIRARYFQKDSIAVQRFVAWFDSLFPHLST